MDLFILVVLIFIWFAIPSDSWKHNQEETNRLLKDILNQIKIIKDKKP